MKKNETISGELKWNPENNLGQFIPSPNGAYFVTYNPALEYLANKYGTDKIGHGYIPHYETHLPSNPGKILEIGCLNGASLRMWKEFFPDTEISVIDIFKDKNNISKEDIEKEGFAAYKGDQSDINFLYTIKDMFNVIIDDGSHNSHHQQISFKHLFVNSLCSGGIYVVEDLHCCKEKYYWGNHVKSFKDTILSVFHEYLKTGKFENDFFNETENRIFNELVADLKIYDDKIAFIRRR